MKQFLCLLGLLVTSQAYCQLEDNVLTYDEYMYLVTSEHPLALQADMQNQFAIAEQLKARGGFDPKIKATHDQKQYEDKQYYHLLKSELKIPTTLGLSLKANYESNEGEFLNPESQTDNIGLWSLGLDANLLRGLFYDRERANLDQAKLMDDITENDRIKLLNKLYLNASVQYVNWVNIEAQKKIIEESIELAKQYVSITKQTYILGDKPAIDTVEAKTILLDRQNRWQENEIERIKARQLASSFLWLNAEPMMLQEYVIPQSLESLPQDVRDLEDVLDTHPEIVDKELKINSLSIEQKLNKENLKPDLSFRFNPLIQGQEDFFIPQQYSPSNFKLGASFSMPLFWRKQRAEVQKTNAKLQETTYQLQNKRNELKNKILAEENKIQIYKEQQTLYQDNLNNYVQLLEAEQIRNEFGETSMFLLNKREEKVLDSRLKIQELENKILQTQLKITYLRNNFVTN